MSDESAQALATEQAADRVSKAAWMNQETYARLHQYDDEAFGLTDKPAPKAKAPKAADKP